MVVHDMRSPLMALLINLGFLKRSGHRAQRRRAARSCRSRSQSAEALNRMANDLLDVSRLEDGKMPLERAVWDLTRMAGDVRSTLGPWTASGRSTSKARTSWK